MEINLTFITVGGHTFCPELLSDGIVIDVGARGFLFAEYFTDKQVYCIDPDASVFDDPKAKALNFHNLNLAISDKAGDGFIYLNQSCPEGTVLKELDPDQAHPFTPCKTITMDDLYKITGENVDILKLDCEGAEYMILGEGFKPIPKQISCEMHKHTVPEMHEKHFESIKKRLSEHYEIFNDVLIEANGCGENLWDILWIRKDLIK